MGQPARHISRYIDRAPADVVRFLGDPKNLPKWASGVSTQIHEENGIWICESPMGKVELRFVDANDLGVLDHHVKLPDGTTFYNPMRVIENGKGSEVLFTVLQRKEMSDEELEKDCATIAKDLETAKSLLESPKTS